jgi:hypothetical protein
MLFGQDNIGNTTICIGFNTTLRVYNFLYKKVGQNGLDSINQQLSDTESATMKLLDNLKVCHFKLIF